jgi:hypothetical protein
MSVKGFKIFVGESHVATKQLILDMDHVGARSTNRRFEYLCNSIVLSCL